MLRNVGTADSLIRIILGLAILFTGYYFGSWFGLIGLIPLLTGVFRVCPAYLPFGFATCPLDENS